MASHSRDRCGKSYHLISNFVGVIHLILSSHSNHHRLYIVIYIISVNTLSQPDAMAAFALTPPIDLVASYVICKSTLNSAILSSIGM